MDNNFALQIGILDIKKILTIIALASIVMFFIGFLSGCATKLEPEMMEWERDYECVVMQDSRVFCK